MMRRGPPKRSTISSRRKNPKEVNQQLVQGRCRTDLARVHFELLHHEVVEEGQARAHRPTLRETGNDEKEVRQPFESSRRRLFPPGLFGCLPFFCENTPFFSRCSLDGHGDGSVTRRFFRILFSIYVGGFFLHCMFSRLSTDRPTNLHIPRAHFD